MKYHTGVSAKAHALYLKMKACQLIQYAENFYTLKELGTILDLSQSEVCRYGKFQILPHSNKAIVMINKLEEFDKRFKDFVTVDELIKKLIENNQYLRHTLESLKYYIKKATIQLENFAQMQEEPVMYNPTYFDTPMMQLEQMKHYVNLNLTEKKLQKTPLVDTSIPVICPRCNTQGTLNYTTRGLNVVHRKKHGFTKGTYHYIPHKYQEFYDKYWK